MSQRKFFKDLTPGELQWLKSNAVAMGIRPDYLEATTDGINKFDIYFSPEVRDNVFNLLDRPSTKAVTIKYDQAWNAVPALDRGTLTDADLNIKNDGVFITPVTLNPAESRAFVEAANNTVAEIVKSRPPVASVEATNALTRSGDHFRQVQKEASAETIAAGQVAFTPTERNNGLTVTSVRYDASNNVIIRDNQGNQRVLNRDEQEQFTRQKEALFSVVAEEENELRYFRSWAEERGLDQREIDFAFTSTAPDATGRSRPITNQDFQNHLDEYKAANGRLPFATPATDQTVASLVNTEQAARYKMPKLALLVAPLATNLNPPAALTPRLHSQTPNVPDYRLRLLLRR
jgi:hypothetical protein